MKHLVIPTDFSLRSLEPIRAAITHFAGEPLTITLLHLLEPPTDILDGLRLAYHKGREMGVPQTFTLAMESIAAVYSGQIHAIAAKTCYGSTTAVVRNLLEHLKADAILFNPQQPFEQSSSQSIDPRPLLRRAMPRGIVETGAPVQKASVPISAVQQKPLRTAALSSLQPAMHDAADSLFSR